MELRLNSILENRNTEAADRIRENELKNLAGTFEISEDGVHLGEAAAHCRKELSARTLGKEPLEWTEYSFRFLLALYFPDNYHAECMEERKDAVFFYLDFLNLLFDEERRIRPFDPCVDFQLLSEQEAAACEILPEYRRFESCFRDGYVYAFLRLSRICTPYNTLGHIAGVHHVAMYMARQLLHLGVKVDPGLMSGAALLHDIGKFGCRQEESRRIPYLHYYYSFQFCDRYGFPAMGNIASNHSVWDLELENLSVESLLLIYADFRVKSVWEKEKGEIACFWNLKESYDIILSKLDNVDDKKRDRYARVYAKLRDFEEYLVSIGCSTDLISPAGTPETVRAGVLMDGEEIVRQFRHLAVRSNLSVMYEISGEKRFYSLLERVRGERDGRHIRALLTVLGDYSAYLRLEQKDCILQFLFDMLSHHEGDIRRQAARIAGRMIAHYPISFTKEIPEGFVPPQFGRGFSDVWEDFLYQMLQPGQLLPERARRWIGYAMKTVLRTLLEETGAEETGRAIEVYTAVCADNAVQSDPLTAFFILNGAEEIPLSACSRDAAKGLAQFALRTLEEGIGRLEDEIPAAALRFLLAWVRQGYILSVDEKRTLAECAGSACGTEAPASVRFLCDSLAAAMEAAPDNTDPAKAEEIARRHMSAGLYLENQRAGVSWIHKLVNLDILRSYFSCAEEVSGKYQYASHLLHLLMFSDRIVNRLQAGRDLLEILPSLPAERRFEVTLELMQAMETGEYSVAKYLPPFLGEMTYMLSDFQQEEILDRLQRIVESNIPAACLALEAAGKILQLSSSRSSGELRTTDLRQRAEGILCLGMVHFNKEIAEDALHTLTQFLFGDAVLTTEEKKMYLRELGKKILSLPDWSQGGLFGFFEASSLRYIYAFISGYMAEESLNGKEAGGTAVPGRKVALFPGTFDPFSMGHKEIVQEIRRKGFEVFVLLDEFSWSKKTQPYRVRRKILALSTADLADVYLFPEEIPVNIANPSDLRRVRELFEGREVWIAVGGDVVENASAYRGAPQPDGIHDLPHIIFSRNEVLDEGRCAEIRSRLRAPAEFLSLPTLYENVSSTLIRDSIARGEDISGLVSRSAWNFIRETGLYGTDPVYKKAVKGRPVETVHAGRIDKYLEEELKKGILRGKMPETIRGRKVTLLREGDASGRILGAVLYHEISVNDLFRESGSREAAAMLRERISGRIISIEEIGGDDGSPEEDRLVVLSEHLAACHADGCSYAVAFHADRLAPLLELCGFVPVKGTGGAETVYVADLRSPVVLYCDLAAALKEPLSEDPLVRRTLLETHLRLQKCVTELYPGNLVLPVFSDILYYRLMKLIMKENGVSGTGNRAGTPGRSMCVPFGKTLRGSLVPGTVTKSLDTEKIYNADMTGFSIREYPGYAPLSVQMRTVRSFGRPVILVDDAIDEGYWMDALRIYMQAEEIPLQKLIVGVLSGRGNDYAVENSIPVSEVYCVPNMRAWLVESDLYPYIGGNGIDSGTDRDTLFRTSLASVNPILPYELPACLSDTKTEALYRISEVCMENARQIFVSLEEAYQKTSGRRLTFARLGEVLTQVRHPDSAGHETAFLEEQPSALVTKERQKLRRLKNLSRML